MEGINRDRHAQISTGNEALLSFSETMIEYTQAQARARQVYNELVPVLSPEDLE